MNKNSNFELSVFPEDEKNEKKQQSLIKASSDIQVLPGFYNGEGPIKQLPTKQNLSPEQQDKKNKIVITLTVFLLIFLSILFSSSISSFIKKVEQEPFNTNSTMPNVISLSLSDAKKMLKDYDVSYEFLADNFYDYGTVIKSSVDEGVELISGQKIHLYISSENESTNIIPNDVLVSALPIKRAGMIFHSFSLKDNKIYLYIENTTNSTVNDILVTFSQYITKSTKLPNRTYYFNDLNLQPNQQTQIEISNINSNTKILDVDFVQILK